MIRTGKESPDEIYSDFIDKVHKVLDDLDEKYDYLKKCKETPRTFAFWTDRIIQKWFNSSGR